MGVWKTPFAVLCWFAKGLTFSDFSGLEKKPKGKPVWDLLSGQLSSLRSQRPVEGFFLPAPKKSMGKRKNAKKNCLDPPRGAYWRAFQYLKTTCLNTPSGGCWCGPLGKMQKKQKNIFFLFFFKTNIKQNKKQEKKQKNTRKKQKNPKQTTTILPRVFLFDPTPTPAGLRHRAPKSPPPSLRPPVAAETHRPEAFLEKVFFS